MPCDNSRLLIKYGPLFAVTRSTRTGEYLEGCCRRMMKTIEVERFAFEMSGLPVVIRPAEQMFADVPTLSTGISTLRARSEQGGVRVVLVVAMLTNQWCSFTKPSGHSGC